MRQWEYVQNNQIHDQQSKQDHEDTEKEEDTILWQKIKHFSMFGDRGALFSTGSPDKTHLACSVFLYLLKFGGHGLFRKNITDRNYSGVSAHTVTCMA